MAQVPNQSTSTSSQSIAQNQVKYTNCLLVSRHQLLKTQQNDLEKICERVQRTDMLPTDTNELKKYVEPYSAVIGVIPLPLQVQLLQFKKSVLLFYMEALGTTPTREQAEELLAKSGLEGVILPPAKQTEPYRVSVYKGLIRVKNIVVEDEWVIQH
jgi:hypothetical protein